MAGPLDDCILFMPSEGGQYNTLNRGHGWAPCNAAQNAFLHANREQHVPARKLRHLHDDDYDDGPWGALAAFNVFVVGGMAHDDVRLCSNCALPGHTKRTCTLDEAAELVDPSEEAA